MSNILFVKFYKLYNESAGAWEVLTTGLNTSDTTGYTGSVETNVSDFSYYGIAGTPVSTTPPAQPPCTSCGSSGGGGGGGTSGENFTNIEIKEKRDNYIFKDTMKQKTNSFSPFAITLFKASPTPTPEVTQTPAMQKPSTTPTPSQKGEEGGIKNVLTITAVILGIMVGILAVANLREGKNE